MSANPSPQQLKPRAMRILDGAGLILGAAGAFMMERAVKGLAEGISGAMAQTLGGDAPAASPRSDELAEFVRGFRKDWKVDEGRRALAESRMSDADAREIIAAADGLAGLPELQPDMRDDDLTMYAGLVLTNEERWSKFFLTVAPIVERLLAE